MMCVGLVGVWVCCHACVLAWALARYSCCVRIVLRVGASVSLSIMNIILCVGWMVTLVLFVCLP